MLRVEPGTIKTSDLHDFILGSVAPRPIAFASTIDENGNPNLAPFSFFNAIGSKPPILVFSANRRVRDNTTKHSLSNIQATREVVINMVTYDIVRQAALASIEYPASVNEFVKAGLTPIPMEKVKPFGVKESPVNIECKVNDIIEFGHEGGAANLFICEILLMHISENVLTPEGKIDPFKMDLCARMNGSYYCRAHGDAIFEIKQPFLKLGIGYDQLPIEIRESKDFSGYQVAQLASVEKIPVPQEVEAYILEDDTLKKLKTEGAADSAYKAYVKRLLKMQEVEKAWKVLLASPGN